MDERIRKTGRVGTPERGGKRKISCHSVKHWIFASAHKTVSTQRGADCYFWTTTAAPASWAQSRHRRSNLDRSIKEITMATVIYPENCAVNPEIELRLKGRTWQLS